MKRTIKGMNLDGGCVCLDFINTVHSRTEMPMDDYLKNYQDIIRWTKRAKILSKWQQQKLLDVARANQAGADNAFKKLIGAREELYGLFHSMALGEIPGKENIHYFNKLLPSALSHLIILPIKRTMMISWNEGNDPLLLPLWIVIKSAYDTLLGEPPERIKACPGCLWLFLDKTKNNKRRWCNSLTCGSTDKAMRYYYRKKAEKVKRI